MFCIPIFRLFIKMIVTVLAPQCCLHISVWGCCHLLLSFVSYFQIESKMVTITVAIVVIIFYEFLFLYLPFKKLLRHFPYGKCVIFPLLNCLSMFRITMYS